MIFEDIANVMNARPVKEIMRKTGLTKNRVYSLRMGCTFHMDYELLFALQRMGYEVRVVGRGATLERSESGEAQTSAPVGPMTARAVSPQAKRRRKPTSAGVLAVGATLERSESRDVGRQNTGPGGADDRHARFSRSETEPEADERRGASAGPTAERSETWGSEHAAPRRGQRPASAVSRSEMEAEADERRGFGRGATLERSESVVGQNIGPGGADDRTRGFAAGETEA